MGMREVKVAICDTAGMYETFTIADVLAWKLSTNDQEVRDAVRELTKEGLLEKMERGVYRWKQ